MSDFGLNHTGGWEGELGSGQSVGKGRVGKRSATKLQTTIADIASTKGSSG
jgi:hypothetical protein